MPIYELSDDLVFPHPLLAEEDGLLAFGGDLRPERLLLAYRNGIFPWYSEEDPILWHAPNPRFVLFPKNVVVSKSMRQVMRSNKFKITVNQNFEQVIASCKYIVRKDQPDTWITKEMQQAYIQLHQLGYAHSVEVWQKEELVGGLYGINLGRVFFGESMFHLVSNASKAAFIYLAQQFPFSIIDCQMETEHLKSLGGQSIPLEDFLLILDVEAEKDCLL
ncbi:leucyl/phenylalanyl-tRNA--protein transferase [Solitalea sp. MAHUQ-68]|uniref:Leucyl/phenylalanyl-tRNA--protein transferase n=1 Tax=Solitalea agri TaxID=2953739 RepID=A0A9X2FB02_9SPHI|nr:leucyl/phenylalanyl-tRNA--protein transferase [Solitalea agri]MCO4293608.1 leucyl/phenylalanyl-tRNA--protein transferase [Solitalea agri]